MSRLVQKALDLLDVSLDPSTNAPAGVLVAPSATTLATVVSKPTPRAVNNAADTAYWLADTPKQGVAAFNKDPQGYKVWRNVKDYGAKGDGVTDDSDAINRAIADQDRCGPWVCDSSTDSPAVVYFPSGTYVIGKAIVMYYMTQLHGNANDLPILKAAPTLQALALIDASPYSNENGEAGWISTNLFMRQIRNFVIDLTPISPEKAAQGIHWPASQATSIQNVKIRMAQSANSQQTGSGGYLVDLDITGGLYGMNIGNQQFTMRGIKISKAQIGISQIWNWGWLYQGLHISDCKTAFSMINGLTNDQLVGSAVIVDSDITNCDTFVDMAWTPNAKPIGAGQLILENIELTNVGTAVKGSNTTVLPGGTTTITAWGQGNKYTPNGPEKFQGPLTPAKRPSELLNGNKYWAVVKPQYERLPLSTFISARTAGAKGDGRTDDTTAIQNAVNRAVSENKIVFFDHGVYKITKTIYLPPGARLVGEIYSVIMASGNTWGDVNNPVPVIQIGKPGERGSIEWSDMVVATQGPTPGAKIIEYNLDTTRGSGIWDVHTRIGGAKGTNLQVAQCPIYTTKPECMSAHTNVHVTKTGNGAYFENNWFWTADHDLDDWNSTRVSIYTGRGMLVEASNVMLWASGVEHHALYQYQFANAKNIFAGFIQTETPYYMPNPDAKSQPYPISSALNDPNYATACPAGSICDAYGLRILNSQSVHVYGAGLYSFFRDYDVSCSSPDAPNGNRYCQDRILSIEGSSTSDVIIYTLNEVGALQMVTIDGQDKAKWSDNLSVYPNAIGLFTYKV
ncbi:glycoside hydrolase family 55 protein [Aaosphaeria arxii CBS 175.79]|uniref:Glycoside hydrolase family 55 protein n=1 Tax=Aaosphaeria arxii CBS 175.79 TaxID=1450172 RepID=A0A6A5XTT6_9PLEO|nr:glycoside hydrolase family 55 protein [Aaosphaeria arxii CBS 175.79]KAF2016131.1 glycoside hydrolase family 55 protein [Aaosphaeria arxii CBS 175.79]